MARLNVLKNDEEEEAEDLPDLATILKITGAEKVLQGAGEADDQETTQNLANSSKQSEKPVQPYDHVSKTISRTYTQKTLNLQEYGLTKLLLPTNSKESLQVMKKLAQDKPFQSTPPIRSTPKRAVRKPVSYSTFSSKKGDRRISMSEGDESSTDLSGFIVPDSESDEGDQQNRRKPKKSQRSSPKPTRSDQSLKQEEKLIPGAFGNNNLSPFTIELYDSPSLSSMIFNTASKKGRQLPAEPFKLEEKLSQLRLSPPISRKPSGTECPESLITPPSSPSKSTLGSPSKKHRIPPSPHRPSIDAFWTQDVIDDWNDQYSPRKPPGTPGRSRLLTLDEDDAINFSSSVSPQKSPAKTLNNKERQALRAFHKEKSKLATTFLSELDKKITNNQIYSLTESTGGTKITWSKKLSSTAGRANWRREALRRKSPDGTFSEPTYRHHASIELAEKVIDCEYRLINVLAHEFCHLANFMISGVKGQPHGKEFKVWAAKVTDLFRDRGVEVTTKHGYDITYKYIWTCGDCGLEYKRHSKSIDPTKHSCGVCKGRLVQLLPAPRKENEYQRFVKANWDRVRKKAGAGAAMGEINGLLAKEWEAKKITVGKGKQLIVEVTEVAANEDHESDKIAGSPKLVDVARKLQFLTLEA